MSIGGVTRLPFQKVGIDQKQMFGVASGKQEQSRVLSQKLQEMSQTYQQKGSIFQTENIKESVATDGYMGKLVDQKWAQVNYEYEQTNVKRLALSNQSLENAVIKTAANVKEHAAKITSTNKEVSELDKQINANTKEIETMSKIFADEKQSKDAKEYAKNNYDYAVNKDNSLSKELSSLDSDKVKSTANIEITKQKKADAGNAIVSFTASKSNVSQRRSSVVSQKASIKFDIDSIKSQISELIAKKGAVKIQQTSVTTANTAAPNTNVAIDTAQTVQQNNTAGATIAEAQNVATVETKEAAQTTQETVQAETIQESIDAQINAQILSLEKALSAKIAQDGQLDNELKAQTSEENQIDKEIQAKQIEQKQADIQIQNEENAVSIIENKIALKQKEKEENQVVLKEKEGVYKKASEAHSADLEKRQAIEANYNKLTAETQAMQNKKNNSDQTLKRLNSLQSYFEVLLDGQGNAKAGTKAELEIAEQKTDKQYETLQVKNGIVENSKIRLFSQKDVTSKAKGDLTSVRTEIEAYANVFSGIKKA